MSESTPRSRRRSQCATSMWSTMTYDGRTVEATAVLVRPGAVATPAYRIECGETVVRVIGGEGIASAEMDRLMLADLGLGNKPGSSGVEEA